MQQHFEDVRRDFNYSSTDVSIFSETRFSHSDSDDMYAIDKYSLFRNDETSTSNVRPFGGTAVYSHIDYYLGYPYYHNTNGVEITVMRSLNLPHVTITGLYRSPRVPLRQLCLALSELLDQSSLHANIFICNFNVNCYNETERAPLYNVFKRNNYRQLVSSCTTNNKTCIDHVYTNLPETNKCAYPLARREAPTAGRRPAGEGANIDRRLVPNTRDACEPNLASSLFIYLYIYLYIIYIYSCARIEILALVNSLKQKTDLIAKQT